MARYRYADYERVVYSGFYIVLLVYYERIIHAEEQFLTLKFGEKYIRWADKTPCFIPAFKGYVKPALKFSWKKVIKQEKNGLAALLLIFSIMDIVGETVLNEPPKYMIMAVITAVVLVAYFVVKYIKHNTLLLEEAGR